MVHARVAMLDVQPRLAVSDHPCRAAAPACGQKNRSVPFSGPLFRKSAMETPRPRPSAISQQLSGNRTLKLQLTVLLVECSVVRLMDYWLVPCVSWSPSLYRNGILYVRDPSRFLSTRRTPIEHRSARIAECSLPSFFLMADSAYCVFPPTNFSMCGHRCGNSASKYVLRFRSESC